MVKINKLANMVVNTKKYKTEPFVIAYCKKYLPKSGYSKNLINFS